MSSTIWDRAAIDHARTADARFLVSQEEARLRREGILDILSRKCYLGIRDILRPLVVTEADIDVHVRRVGSNPDDRHLRERRIGLVVTGRWQPDVQTFRIDAPGHPAHGSIHTAPGVPWNPYNIAVAPALLGLTGSPTAPEAVTHRKDVFQCDGWDPIHRIWIYREGERA